MWNHLTKNKINEFILSLNLIDDDNLTDKQKLKLLYTLSNEIEKHYRVFKIPKKKGGYRTIYEPDLTLKRIQRNILNNCLQERVTSSYAIAYKNGYNLIDNAKVHSKKKVILKLDIKDFFPSISFLDVYKYAFPRHIYPEAVASLLTNLVTYNNFLPQGAPTSGYISNLVLRSFDLRVGEYTKEKGIDYTRYCDDMTFSGDFDAAKVISFVKQELTKRGFTLNRRKITVIKRNKAQIVTGVVCNQNLNVPRLYQKKIRQEMYYITRYGLGNHLKRLNYQDDDKTYVEKLYGKILFVLQITPQNSEFIEYKKILQDLKRTN